MTGPEVSQQVDLLVGDAGKAREGLNWKPRTTFRELVRLMVDSDVAALEGVRSEGLQIDAAGR